MHRLTRDGCLRMVCVALFAAGCGNALVPRDVAGTYRLELRDGAVLPALVLSGDATDVYLVSETLVLGADRRGSITWVHEFRHIGAGMETSTAKRDIAFDIVDGRIEIDMTCGPTELCTAPPHLVLRRTARGLESLATLGTQPSLVYGRVAVAGFAGLP